VQFRSQSGILNFAVCQEAFERAFPVYSLNGFIVIIINNEECHDPRIHEYQRSISERSINYQIIFIFDNHRENTTGIAILKKRYPNIILFVNSRLQLVQYRLLIEYPAVRNSRHFKIATEANFACFRKCSSTSASALMRSL
jgi:hypothetical protein